MSSFQFKSTFPILDHLQLDDFNYVYEPAEDTFLLCDGIKIDFENINSEILHIFPITISLSITLLLASYILLL
jgi:hypothetical protein